LPQQLLASQLVAVGSDRGGSGWLVAAKLIARTRDSAVWQSFVSLHSGFAERHRPQALRWRDIARSKPVGQSRRFTIRTYDQKHGDRQ
jgi:hypothetical protein